MSAKESILVIEDDPDIVELVQYNLEREGYRVHSASDGEKGLKEAAARKPALILLDLMLPGIEGLEVCRRLKASTETDAIPIIMLTAKGEESDIVLGLGLGADDYVTKPFSPKELAARIQAVLRRGGLFRDAKEPPGRVEAGPVAIDAERHEVTVNGKPVSLTLAEFRLLQTLAASPGRVFTRDTLVERITGGRSIVIDRNVDVHIRALRKKLKRAAERIQTVRGVGYKFSEK